MTCSLLVSISSSHSQGGGGFPGDANVSVFFWPKEKLLDNILVKIIHSQNVDMDLL